ncbi:cyclic GMP-AMP synthase [Diretmus argenteus]
MTPTMSVRLVQRRTPGRQRRPSPSPHWIRLSAQDLKIRQKDRRWAAEMANDFRDSLLKFLKKNDDQPYFQSADFFNSGSYFEMVKSPPCTLSASRILSEMHHLVRKFIKTYRVSDELCPWVVNRKRPNSPAVSLFKIGNNSEELISVDVVPALEGSPLAARNGPDVDNWLGKKTRQEINSLNCFFVPKRLKGCNLSEAAKGDWRISFSHIEKNIIRSHGNKKTCCESAATKCCRKQCLQLLKCLIEGLKLRFPQQLDALCSYHGKTVFLHTLSIRFKDSMRARPQLPACFLHLLGALDGHTRSGILPHFFVPDCNLFSPAAFPRRALAFLTGALGEQRREGLPLLKPPAPAPPLAQQAMEPVGPGPEQWVQMGFIGLD